MMKKIKLFIQCAFMIMNLTLIAQSKEDSLAIEKACRNYVEGWAEGNTDRVAKGVSPELHKLILQTDQQGESYSNSMTASRLLNATKANRGGVKIKDLKPDEKFKLEVYIYDITGDNALVKTVAAKYEFFDYCQLAKFNGEWKIFNVLWGYIPSKK